MTWLELAIDFELSTGLDIPRKLESDGRTPTGEPPGQGSLGERMRVLAQAVQRMERLLGEQVVPGGVSGAVHRQRQLGALGLPSGLELPVLWRRPLLSGGAESECVLRRLGNAGDAAIGRGEEHGRRGHAKGWLNGVRPSYEGVRRGDATRWTAASDAADLQTAPKAADGRARQARSPEAAPPAVTPSGDAQLPPPKRRRARTA